VYARDDRSLGDLFADLSRETSTLVRQEIVLARKEMTQKVSAFGRDAAMIAAGGLIAYAGFLCLLGFLVVALYIVLHHWWLSALIVSLVALGTGGFLIQQGLTALKRVDMSPRRTIESLQQNADWAADMAKERAQ